MRRLLKSIKGSLVISWGWLLLVTLCLPCGYVQAQPPSNTVRVPALENAELADETETQTKASQREAVALPMDAESFKRKPLPAKKETNPYFVWGDTLAQWIATGAAVGALIASVAGVLLVYGTLRATSRQLLIENRPWIRINDVKVTEELSRPGYISASVEVDYENVGNSPALQIAVEVEYPSVGIDASGDLARFAEGVASLYRERRYYHGYLFPNERVNPESSHAVPNDGEKHKSTSFAVFCVVLYKSDLSDRLFYTATSRLVMRSKAAIEASTAEMEVEDVGYSANPHVHHLGEMLIS